MPENTESRSIVSRMANTIADYHTSSPVTSILLAVLSELPLVGIGKEAIDQAVSRIHEKRFKTLLDELKAGEILLTDEVIQSEEFLHSFVVVYRAAINTYHIEKIRYFGRLLLSATECDELASSTFEEFTEILTNLSIRELALLKTLRSIEDKNSLHIASNSRIDDEVELTKKIWPEFSSTAKDKFGISAERLPAMLIRLGRTGLYEPVSGLIFGYSEGIGRTTDLYTDFSNWILRQADIDTH